MVNLRKHKLVSLARPGIILLWLLCLMSMFPASPTLADTVITAVYPYFDSTNLQAFQLNGNAVLSGSRLQLTQPVTWSNGSAWWQDLVSLLDNRSFSAYFSFEISEPGNDGADGMVFVIQTQSNAAGGAGGGIGYQDISPSLGIEFDTWYNNALSDPSGNHIGLDIDGSLVSLVTASPPDDASLESGIWHVWVDYDGLSDALEVRMNTSNSRPTTATLTSSIDLEAVFGPDVYVGFTSATGTAWAYHEILSFYFNNDYIPGGINPDTETYTQAPTQVDLSASPASIPANGIATSAILATVRSVDGSLLPNQAITFTTDLGTLNPLVAITDSNGVAATTLSATTTAGVATVRGTSAGGAYGEAEITFESYLNYSVYLPHVGTVGDTTE